MSQYTGSTVQLTEEGCVSCTLLQSPFGLMMQYEVVPLFTATS